jgi:hypothetical protein
MTDISYGALQGMRVDPDGRITYDFDGHVRAQGVDLDRDGPFVSNLDSRLRWLDAAGVARAYLLAFQDSGVTDGTALLARIVEADGSVAAELRFDEGELTIDFGVQPSGISRTLFDGAGDSSFAQLPSALPSRIVAGCVNADGTLRRAITGGWSSARTGVGLYTVIFDVPYGSIAPAVLVTPLTTASQQRLNTVADGSFDVALANGAGVGVDSDFSFLALGLD